jgi:hypothetical protein
MSLFNRKPKQIKIEDLETLVYGNDLDIAKRLRDFIADYKQEIKDIDDEEVKAFQHFSSLGIPKEALLSPVRESPNCNKLVFSKDDYSEKEYWHCVYDWDTNIRVDWSAENLLEVLASIEKESKQTIINFGLSNNCIDDLDDFTYDDYWTDDEENNDNSDYKSDYADKDNNIVFGKIKDEVSLDECCDSFNLQLSNGNYYHLYFCENK